MNQESASWNMEQETESGWESGKKKRRVRLMLLTGAALEILWMAGSAGGGISIKDVDQVQWIGEDISTGTLPSRTGKTGGSGERIPSKAGKTGDSGGRIPSEAGKNSEADVHTPLGTEKTGVSIRMDDGTISIFKVNEHLEGGSD